MTPSEPRAELRRLLYGYRAAQCVYVAAALGLPDLLAGGARPSAELAAATAADRDTLERLLVALVALDLLRRDGDRFALTPLGELLRGDVAGSLRAETLHAMDATAWGPWGDLLASVRSGAAAFPRQFSSGAWEYRAAHPESRARFDAMVAARSPAECAAIAERLSLPERGLVVDVGGGDGELLAALLRRRPGLTGALVEQAAAVAAAGPRLAAAGVASRCQLVTGDFFAALPAGGELYLLKAVLHNWDDRDALRLLRNCRRAMASHSRLVVVEAVADAAGAVDFELQDLHMLVIHGGRERTAAGLAELLRQADLRLLSLVDSSAGSCLIEGVPA